jgi:hypothetical protein
MCDHICALCESSFYHIWDLRANLELMWPQHGLYYCYLYYSFQTWLLQPTFNLPACRLNFPDLFLCHCWCCHQNTKTLSHLSCFSPYTDSKSMNASNVRFFCLPTEFSRLINQSTFVIFSLIGLSQGLVPLLLLLFCILLLLDFTWIIFFLPLLLFYKISAVRNFVIQLVSLLVLLLFLS